MPPPLVFLIAALCLSPIAALSFSPDFNSTIPSILGLTNFSYPSPSNHIESGYADGVINTAFHQPWPSTNIRGRLNHYIRFCYADQASKDALHCSFPAAL
ncbi:hypothetical protein BU23DRAFT_551939 [Bimuria novae-zelandiae CBS 107.79]|uniref:Uncharacterized protein n=1 Tax=Bimuria novae-zelandiae CBS 107.79 TaxID=1447943 RepID=A0A6A5VFH7_9PLEO|nr:hypothetical protein BU23DRAFT_551939 [Bimuria novae-zelandiae CBS 107.79]